MSASCCPLFFNEFAINPFLIASSSSFLVYFIAPSPSLFLRDSNVDVRHKLAKILASASSSPALSNDNWLVTPDIPPPPPSSYSTPTKAGSGSGATDGGGSGVGVNGHDESGISNNYYCDTPINDLVDPVDYEDYIVSNSARISTHLRPILLFPSDDIQVEKFEPPLRTLESTSAPEFNNVQTSEDPYIQSIGTYTPKSLVVIKKYAFCVYFKFAWLPTFFFIFRYEKCPSIIGLGVERQSRSKCLKRQEYEIDLSSTFGDELFDDDASDTPNTFYSRRTSVKNTPRPQSLVSSTSTVRPPLASDEDDFSDEEHDENCKTPLAGECDIPPIDSNARDDASDLNSLNGDSRNSWVYTDASCNIDQFNTFGSKTKSFFSLQNAQSDPHIQGILEKNFYNCFFDNLPVYYSNGSSAANVSTSDEGGNDNDKEPVFCLHSMQYEEEQIESRPSIPTPSDVTRYRLQVKCLSLKMDLCVEPIFASIAVYDAKEKRKVTENFYFDMNPGKRQLQLNF